MRSAHRSGCPINLVLEVVGDKWSLLVIRDIVFGNRRYFRELLTKSEEGIASNILANRLKRLVEQSIITRSADASHHQKAVYSLTEAGIQLVPVLATMGGWGRKHLPVSKALAIRAQLLEEGGPTLWAQFMNELRERHLRVPTSNTPRSRARSTTVSVSEQLRAAYEAAVGNRRRT